MSAVHYLQGRYLAEDYTRCGITGRTTRVIACVTCRICKFGILVDAAPWARAFLDELRGNKATVTSPNESERDKNLRTKGYHITGIKYLYRDG